MRRPDAHDARGYQVAVVPAERLGDLLDLLEEERWGAIQLPPADVARDTAREWVALVAEQVAEYVRNGYALVLVAGSPYDDELDAALSQLGLPPLPRSEATREALAPYAIRPGE